MMEINLSERDQRWIKLMGDTTWYQEYEQRLLGMSTADCAYQVARDICDQLASLMASMDWQPRTRQEHEDYWDMLARFRAQMNGLHGVLAVKRALERMGADD